MNSAVWHGELWCKENKQLMYTYSSCCQRPANMSGYKKSTFISSNNNNRQITHLIAKWTTWYIHCGTHTVERTMELLKVVVLVSAFVLFTIALSIEGEQKSIVKIFRKSWDCNHTKMAWELLAEWLVGQCYLMCDLYYRDLGMRQVCMLYAKIVEIAMFICQLQDLQVAT